VPQFAASNRLSGGLLLRSDPVVFVSEWTFPLWVSPFCPDGANKFVNEFATDRLRALNGSCGYFWIQMCVRISDLFRGHRWGRVGQLDSVVEKFSFQAMYFHDDSFLG